MSLKQKVKVMDAAKSQNEAPYVRTVSGTKVEFLNPWRDQIKIRDIAYGLAGQCRFTCQLPKFYSTAEHSILGMGMAPSFDIAKFFLIHDASEYIFSDLASPIKRLLPDYKIMEGNFQTYLNGILFRQPTAEEVDIIKDIDGRMCATEMRDLRGSKRENWEAIPYPKGDIEFQCLNWNDAYNLWLRTFTIYFPEIDIEPEQFPRG